MHFHFTKSVILAGCLGAVAASPAHAQKIYWHDYQANKIKRADPDGSNAENLVDTTAVEVGDIAFDQTGGRVYWTEPAEGWIRRANLDGGNPEIVLGTDGPWALAIDEVNRRIYWSRGEDDGLSVNRADLDGQNEEVVIPTNHTLVEEMEIDPLAGKVYLLIPDGYIARANLDGSQIETIVAGSAGTSTLGMALDLMAGKVYWTDFFPGSIRRANLDGSDVETLPLAVFSPYELAVDPCNRTLYWSEDGGRARRARFDGAQAMEVIESGVGSLALRLPYDGALGTPKCIPTLSAVGLLVLADGLTFGAALVLGRRRGAQTVVIVACLVAAAAPRAYAQKIYWHHYDTGSNKIKRANLDGSNPEDLVDLAGAALGDITIDQSWGKIYWTEWAGIRRANLDGTAVETFLPEYEAGALAIDEVNRRIYWGRDIDGNRGINRMSLGGGPVEDIASTGYQHVSVEGIAIDVFGGKIYFNLSFGPVYRANLDGSQKELVIPDGGVWTSDLVLDPVNRKLYWPDHDGSALWRANLDGSGVENLPIPVSDPYKLELDACNQMIYWNEVPGGPLGPAYRARINGEQVQQIIPSGVNYLAATTNLDTTSIPAVCVPALSWLGIVILAAGLAASAALVLRSRIPECRQQAPPHLLGCTALRPPWRRLTVSPTNATSATRRSRTATSISFPTPATS